MKILRAPLNVGSIIMIMLILKYRKYRGFVHRDCNMNVKLNHKILIVFHNLKILFLFYYAGTRKIQS